MKTNLALTQPQNKIAALGFMWNMLHDPLHTLTELACEKGDIARVKLCRQELFLLNHPEFIEQVLVKQQENFIKRTSEQHTQIILGEGLLTSEGKENLAQHRIFQSAFHRQRMEEYLPAINENTFAHVSKWQTGARVDVSTEMIRLTLYISLWLFFGCVTEGTLERFSKSMPTLTRLFPLAPLPNTVHKLFPKFIQARADLHQVAESLLKNSQTEGKGILISLLKENNNGQFTNEQIHAYALTFLLAGHEKTALLLTWCWDMLAHHPQVQEKLQAETDRVIGNRFPTMEEIQNLPYTNRVVKETLRMRPPVWAIGRQALKDCEIGGQHIPKNSTVIVSQWVTHHDARFYDAPYQFLPERWENLEKLPRYAFFPFGGGSRACNAEHLAMTEVIVILTMIARRWNVSPTQVEPATPTPGVTLRTNKNVKLIVGRRDV